ncbi:MAG TPA: RNA-guided endonuclease TnpB family protein [Thermoplasmata archaeon]|nr:RNA-guided endonuclease TnpB family protein [Thermoplasmata archaeon]
MRLEVSPEERDALLRTMEAMNRACDAVGEVAFREKCRRRTPLHHRTYSMVRARFGLSAQMAVRAIGKVGGAYVRDPSRQPTFRLRGAVPYDPRILSWKGEGRERVSLLALDGRHEFRVRWSEYGRQAVARGKLRGEADLVYRDRAFYLSLVVESRDPRPYEPVGALGVDLGVVNLAVDSDGTTYKADGVDRVRTRTDRFRAHLQRVGTRSAKRHLKALGRREGNFRRQTNHCISKEIVARAEGTARAVALEDLEGIRARTTVRRSQRRRHLSWSFAQLRAFVEYKAAAKGVPVVLVDPRNTSRTCPRCGTIDRKNRRTREEFRCVSCGLAGPADRIAATNIAARAGVDRPIVAGSEEVWGHVSDLSCKPLISIGGR